MKSKIKNQIKKYNLIQENDKIILAISGGPDSIAMLHVINEIQKESKTKFELIVAHVNHMIREEAGEDEEYVKQFCEKLQIPFYSKHIEVLQIAKESKQGVEETGRYERYKFFDELMKKTGANKIAIAHNKNDNAETMIMHVLRGSGISGLKGLEPIKENKYIRPLLDCTRQEIEKYCEENNLQPRIDKTNFDNAYTRNKIRNVVIPYIKEEFNPNIIETLDRLSEIIKEEDEYIQKQVIKVYNELLIEENTKEIVLNLKNFNLQERVIKSKVLLYTITRLFGDAKGIEKVHVDDMIKLCENNIGNKFLTPNKNLKIFIKKGQIFLSDQR